jgi:hypothetical protein
MRWGAFIFLGSILSLGCASTQSARPEAPSPVAQRVDDDGAVVASLLLEPPLVASEPKIEISRQGRAPQAYAGFEEIISTYYYLRVDDRQLNYSNSGGRSHDRFEREAITTRVGVSYR